MRLEVLLKIFLYVVDLQIGLIVTEYSWVLHILHWVDFETNGKWSGRLNILRECRQDHVLQLNGMVWQGIDKIEMEITDELRVVLKDHENDIHSCSVETPHGC